jgi:hypothetical protein
LWSERLSSPKARSCNFTAPRTTEATLLETKLAK